MPRYDFGCIIDSNDTKQLSQLKEELPSSDDDTPWWQTLGCFKEPTRVISQTFSKKAAAEHIDALSNESITQDALESNFDVDALYPIQARLEAHLSQYCRTNYTFFRADKNNPLDPLPLPDKIQDELEKLFDEINQELLGQQALLLEELLKEDNDDDIDPAKTQNTKKFNQKIYDAYFQDQTKLESYKEKVRQIYFAFIEDRNNYKSEAEHRAVVKEKNTRLYKQKKSTTPSVKKAATISKSTTAYSTNVLTVIKTEEKKGENPTEIITTIATPKDTAHNNNSPNSNDEHQAETQITTLKKDGSSLSINKTTVRRSSYDYKDEGKVLPALERTIKRSYTPTNNKLHSADQLMGSTEKVLRQDITSHYDNVGLLTRPKLRGIYSAGKKWGVENRQTETATKTLAAAHAYNKSKRAEGWPLLYVSNISVNLASDYPNREDSDTLSEMYANTSMAVFAIIDDHLRLATKPTDPGYKIFLGLIKKINTDYHNEYLEFLKKDKEPKHFHKHLKQKKPGEQNTVAKNLTMMKGKLNEYLKKNTPIHKDVGTSTLLALALAKASSNGDLYLQKCGFVMNGIIAALQPRGIRGCKSGNERTTELFAFEDYLLKSSNKTQVKNALQEYIENKKPNAANTLYKTLTTELNKQLEERRRIGHVLSCNDAGFSSCLAPVGAFKTKGLLHEWKAISGLGNTSRPLSNLFTTDPTNSDISKELQAHKQKLDINKQRLSDVRATDKARALIKAKHSNNTIPEIFQSFTISDTNDKENLEFLLYQSKDLADNEFTTTIKDCDYTVFVNPQDGTSETADVDNEEETDEKSNSLSFTVVNAQSLRGAYQAMAAQLCQKYYNADDKSLVFQIDRLAHTTIPGTDQSVAELVEETCNSIMAKIDPECSVNISIDSELQPRANPSPK
jgi:hypothetical protein